VRLVRRPAEPDGSEVRWDPSRGIVDTAAMEDLHAVVHLAGAGIADRRWTARRKDELWDSRVDATRHLVASLAGLERPPRRFLGGSAIGYYGSRGVEQLDESSTAGTGFLSELCVAWEKEAQAALAFAERVYALRTGIVLSTAGGALAKMLLPFRLGFGGRIGSGEQSMSWITLDDEVGAILHLLDSDLDSGPVNLTAADPATNTEFTKALGRALGRPTLFPLPTFVVRTAFGEMGEEALLGSQHVLPRRLQTDGYHFRQPDLETALTHILRGR
jgi:uncharacterized protein (TIGR01777 family)